MIEYRVNLDLPQILNSIKTNMETYEATVSAEVDGQPCDPRTDERAIVEVEYWLRLLLTKPAAPDQKEPTQHWDTHPIILEPASDAGSV